MNANEIRALDRNRSHVEHGKATSTDYDRLDFIGDMLREGVAQLATMNERAERRDAPTQEIAPAYTPVPEGARYVLGDATPAPQETPKRNLLPGTAVDANPNESRN